MNRIKPTRGIFLFGQHAFHEEIVEMRAGRLLATIENRPSRLPRETSRRAKYKNRRQSWLEMYTKAGNCDRMFGGA